MSENFAIPEEVFDALGGGLALRYVDRSSGMPFLWEGKGFEVRYGFPGSLDQKTWWVCRDGSEKMKYWDGYSFSDIFEEIEKGVPLIPAPIAVPPLPDKMTHPALQELGSCSTEMGHAVWRGLKNEMELWWRADIGWELWDGAEFRKWNGKEFQGSPFSPACDICQGTGYEGDHTCAACGGTGVGTPSPELVSEAAERRTLKLLEENRKLKTRLAELEEELSTKELKEDNTYYLVPESVLSVFNFPAVCNVPSKRLYWESDGMSIMYDGRWNICSPMGNFGMDGNLPEPAAIPEVPEHIRNAAQVADDRPRLRGDLIHWSVRRGSSWSLAYHPTSEKWMLTFDNGNALDMFPWNGQGFGGAESWKSPKEQHNNNAPLSGRYILPAEAKQTPALAHLTLDPRSLALASGDGGVCWHFLDASTDTYDAVSYRNGEWTCGGRTIKLGVRPVKVPPIPYEVMESLRSKSSSHAMGPIRSAYASSDPEKGTEVFWPLSNHKGWALCYTNDEWALVDGSGEPPDLHYYLWNGDAFAGQDKLPMNLSREVNEEKELKLADDSTDPKILADLATSSNAQVRSKVARNPHAHSETLRVLANDASLARDLARHRNCPPELLAILASYDEEDVQTAIALNVHTDSETLTDLSRMSSTRTRAAVARHPNTLENVLHKLANDDEFEVRSAVGKNPTTPTLLLERLAKMGGKIAWAAAGNANADLTVKLEALKASPLDEETARLLANDSDWKVRLFAAQGLRREEDLSQMENDKDPRVRVFAARSLYQKYAVARRMLGSETVDDLRAVTESDDADVLELFGRYRAKFSTPDQVDWMRNPNLPEKVWAMLPTANPDVQRVLASNPKLPESYAWDISTHEDPEVRISLIRNPSTPSSILTKMVHGETDLTVLQELATCPSVFARKAVVVSDHVTVGMLKTLAADAQQEVRHKVALRDDIPSDVEEVLMQNSDLLVRLQLAEKTRSPNILSQIAKETTDIATYIKVAQNPHTSEETLKSLATYRNSGVRAAAVRHPKFYPEAQLSLAAGEKSPAVLTALYESAKDNAVLDAVAGSPHTPEEVLRKLAQHQDLFIRIKTAQNPSTPADLLQEAANSSLPGLRAAAAGNSHTPVENLTVLVQDEAAETRYLAARTLPQGTQVTLARDSNDEVILTALASRPVSRIPLEVSWELGKNPHTTPKILERLASCVNIHARYLVANHPNTPVLTLMKLAGDEHPKVRQAVSANPSTSGEALRALTQDDDPDVASEADNTLAARKSLATHEIDRDPSFKEVVLNAVGNSMVKAVGGALIEGVGGSLNQGTRVAGLLTETGRAEGITEAVEKALDKI